MVQVTLPVVDTLHPQSFVMVVNIKVTVNAWQCSLVHQNFCPFLFLIRIIQAVVLLRGCPKF